jgi:hypothetical protein
MEWQLDMAKLTGTFLHIFVMNVSKMKGINKQSLGSLWARWREQVRSDTQKRVGPQIQDKCFERKEKNNWLNRWIILFIWEVKKIQYYVQRSIS